MILNVLRSPYVKDAALCKVTLPVICLACNKAEGFDITAEPAA
jgi:hypothetical protein